MQIHNRRLSLSQKQGEKWKNGRLDANYAVGLSILNQKDAGLALEGIVIDK